MKFDAGLLFCLYALGCIIGIIIYVAVKDNKEEITPKKVVIRNKIYENSDNEIWRTSIYSIDSVYYDTIPKKVRWDTSHELPR